MNVRSNISFEMNFYNLIDNVFYFNSEFRFQLNTISYLYHINSAFQMMSFTLLNASAGSGKTQRITLEFLRLILPNPNEAARILAITFTNKAAGEMKERLISSLAELARNPEKSKLLHDLRQSFPQWDIAFLKNKSEEALKFALHHYADIAIGTIDSFMQRIIRTFARDLQLPAQYEVSVGDDELNELIVSALIESANIDSNNTTILKEMIRTQTEESGSPLSFEHILIPLIKHLTQEASIEMVEDITSRDQKALISAMYKLSSVIAHFQKSYLEHLSEIQSLLDTKGVSENDFIRKYNTSVFSWFHKEQSSHALSLPPKTVIKLIESGQILIEPNPETEKALIAHAIAIIDLIPQIRLGRRLRSGFPVVALLSAIWKIREQWKVENSAVPVSDFNRIIRRVLSQEPIPFIYLRAGSRFKTIMIDEFQDTSFMQWQNLLPLIHESLSSGHSSWVVGDPKQSIYRWRNGQVEIMLRLPELHIESDDAPSMKGIEGLIEHSFHSEPMETNYRSEKAIISFNNAFYRFASQQFRNQQSIEDEENPIDNHLGFYAQVYQQIEQKSFKEGNGYIECRFYQGKPGDLAENWLSDIHSQIIQCLNDGYRLSDMAILTRERTTGVEISAYLMSLEQPIPVLSRETLEFRSSAVCRLVMSTLRLLHCPEDELNASSVWMLLKQISLQDFHQHSTLSDFKKQGKTERGKILLEYLQSHFPGLNRQKTIFLSPADQIDLIIHELGLSDKGGYFLLFLREEIGKQQEKTGYHAEKIWQWWVNKGSKTSVIIPDHAEAVNVMTIHTSKGLQFPVVIIPRFNINEASKINKNQFWFETDEDLWGIPWTVLTYVKENHDNALHNLYRLEKIRSQMDTLNLMYVATTRAEERLYMYAFRNPEPKKANKTGQQTDIKINSVDLLNCFFRESKDYTVSQIGIAEVYSSGEKCHKISKTPDSVAGPITKRFFVNPDKPLKTLRSVSLEGDTASRRRSASRGRVIHELLSCINGKADIPEVLSKFHDRGMITGQEKQSFLPLLKQVTEECSFAFSESAIMLNEREICDEDQKLYRPDRIIAHPDHQWGIVDFKTGSFKTEHIEQVTQYANLLKNTGKNIKTAHILYIDVDEGTFRAVSCL